MLYSNLDVVVLTVTSPASVFDSLYRLECERMVVVLSPKKAGLEENENVREWMDAIVQSETVTVASDNENSGKERIRKKEPHQRWLEEEWRSRRSAGRVKRRTSLLGICEPRNGVRARMLKQP